MEKRPNKPAVNFSSLMCALGHDYMITNTITPYIKEYKCCNCGREVTDDLDGKLQILTEKYRLVNECLNSFLIRRDHRVKVTV
jgi:DNA-directed RNA polymerase subunit RPC12/RpoP